MFSLQTARVALLALVGVVAAPSCARAAAAANIVERVTLVSGFEMDCVRREVIDGGRVRLFTSADSYVEVDQAKIQSVSRVEIASVATVAKPAAIVDVPVPLKVEITSLLKGAEQRHNVDVDLLAAVVRAESGGRTKAVSHAGAQGLMQLMPGTARTLGVTDTFAPEQNIDGGSAYLDQLLTRYHDNLQFALAAYNAGPGAVDRYHGVPPYRETRAYVARVINEFNRRKRAQKSATVASAKAE